MTDRMKTFVINGVPYRMRGDMKIPYWKSSNSEKNEHSTDRDPFREGHLNYLTTPQSCEKKREKEGDGCTYGRGGGKAVRYDAVEDQTEMEYDL